MYRTYKFQEVLEILARNVAKNVQPELVDSEQIAKELDMGISETKQILKIMQSMGVIESTLEAEYSLITKAGLNSLNQHMACSHTLEQNNCALSDR